MAEYGLTPEGVNIKRRDVILKELQDELTDKWGVDVSHNQKSFLNVHLTNLADHLAELWEMGADVYYSQYPLSAEGMYLDGVGQFVGTWREMEEPSYYHILCTGKEGTAIPIDALISTDTNPPVYLVPSKAGALSRDAFNSAVVKVVKLDGNPLSIILNGDIFTYTPTVEDTDETAIEALAAIITGSFIAEVDEATGYLKLSHEDSISVNTMTLSENLTTETIGCVITFQTMENGNIYLPEGSVTKISKAISGLISVTNAGTYIAGRLKETDTEYRQSYIDKIFSHSSRMADSIRSSILTNCKGVRSVVVYENPTNLVDAYGRYPHSVEVVCDGGDPDEIAEQILNTKAGGISTYG